jgi:tetratricopeptide (TPR) repeat protein
VYLSRGLAKVALGYIEDAIADWDKAILIEPKYAEAYYARGLAKFNQGDRQGAFYDWSESVKLFELRGATKELEIVLQSLENLARYYKLQEDIKNLELVLKLLNQIK